MRIHLWATQARSSVAAKYPYIEVSVDSTSSDGPCVVASLLSNASTSAKEGLVLERIALRLDLEFLSLQDLILQAKSLCAVVKLKTLSAQLAAAANSSLFSDCRVEYRADHIALVQNNTTTTMISVDSDNKFAVSVAASENRLESGRRRWIEETLNNDSSKRAIIEAFPPNRGDLWTHRAKRSRSNPS